MDVRLLEAFRAVVDHRSVTRAAAPADKLNARRRLRTPADAPEPRPGHPNRRRPPALAGLPRHLRLRRPPRRHRQRDAARSRWSRAEPRRPTGTKGRSIPVPYGGWSATKASLLLPGGATAPCHPLVRSIATPPAVSRPRSSISAAARRRRFEAHAGDLRGRIALVRHELMFVAGTIHRRRKYLAALEAGAVGIPDRRAAAGPAGRGLVRPAGRRGHSRRRHHARDGCRAAAHGARLADGDADHRDRGAAGRDPHASVRSAGQTDEWIVLSAHVDGHDGGESAMDNASGLAAVLAAARALAPHVGGFRRGVRLAFFSVEEWALTGSAQYVQRPRRR